MLVKMRVFDESQEEVVYYQTEINASGLVQVAKEREPMMREKGKAFTQGAVPFFGEQFIKAVQADDEVEIKKCAMQAAMAAWLADSIYGGVGEDIFKACDLEFNLHPTGMVIYNRIPTP